MTRPRRLPLAVAALCILALGLAGCSSPAGPTTGPCVVETVFSGRAQVAASTFLVQPVTTARTGRLEVTVDWVSPASIVGVVFAQAPCSAEQFRDDHCNVILNLFPPPKPLEASTFWLGPGTYDLVIGNFTAIEESVSMDVTLRSTGCPAPGRE
jgi:hypothetical protein